MRRLLALEKGARRLGVGEPAPDEDACRQLADLERLGQLGLHPVRARTDCPGALVHRSATVRGASDDILGRVKELFLLDPDVVYLNHGSYGACPRPGLRALPGLAARARARAGRPHLTPPGRPARGRASGARGATSARRPDDLTFVQNATTGVNMAARALDLQPGDEVLSTDLEYGACDFTWEHVCGRRGARTCARRSRCRSTTSRTRSSRAHASARAPSTSRTSRPRPASSSPSRRSSRAPAPQGLVDDRRRRTRAGARRPRPRRARRRLLRRQLPQVDVRAEGRRLPARRDRLAGARRRPDRQLGLREPATFISRTERQGTRDPAAYLAVPDAIAFVREHDVRDRCVALARAARAQLCELLGTEPLSPDEAIRQLVSVGCRTPSPTSRSSSSTTSASRSRRWGRGATTCCGSRSRPTRSGRTSSGCSTPSRSSSSPRAEARPRGR